MTNTKPDHSTAIKPQAVVLLYERGSGSVVATHYFAAVAGVDLPEARELEAIAYSHADHDGVGDAASLAVLHAQPGDIPRGKAIRVCPDTGLIKDVVEPDAIQPVKV